MLCAYMQDLTPGLAQWNTRQFHGVEAICQRLYAEIKRCANGAVPADGIAIIAIRFTGPLQDRLYPKAWAQAPPHHLPDQPY